MFIRLIVLIALLGIFGATFLYLVFNAISSRRRKHNIRLAIQQADDKERRIWNASENVQELISLYTRMVFKHGPDSDEAQSFRFGAENRELSSDSEALEAFNRVADIIRYNVKQQKKGRV